MPRFIAVFSLIVMMGSSLMFAADNWPQGYGPNSSFAVSAKDAPTEWSVVREQNIAWRKTLSESGQSTVTIWGDKIFFSINEDAEVAVPTCGTIIAYCCEAGTGKTLWTKKIEAKYPLRFSGCFSDASAPPPVTDGKHVCFFNAGGRVTCFDLEGKEVWSNEMMAVGRSQPFLIGENVVFTKQSYMPKDGKFGHNHKDAGIEMWTQLQALNLATGKEAWMSKCGVNMGSIPTPHQLADGKQVIIVGRGGGHSPPEKPLGISMVDASNGATIWTCEFEGFMSTMTYGLYEGQVLVFHGAEHFWVDAKTGEITKKVNIHEGTPLRAYADGKYETKECDISGSGKKKRCIIQSSNLQVGKYNYFRSYTHPYLGRVNAENGAVEFLQLPTQLMREPGDDADHLLYSAADIPNVKPGKGGKVAITAMQYRKNDMKNSRGIVVMGDGRSQGVGWGHYASQLPTAIGDNLYVPTMSGTVYVIDHDAKVLDEKAIVAINDLGIVGKAWNRASLSYSNGHIFAHTISEVICIGN